MRRGKRLFGMIPAIVLAVAMLAPALGMADSQEDTALENARRFMNRLPVVSAIGTVHYRGGLEGGCWVFVVERGPRRARDKVYELRGGGDDLYEDGVRARVYGFVREDVESVCQVGPVLVVTYYRILRPRPAYGVMLLLDKPVYWPKWEQIGPGLDPEPGEGPIRLEPPTVYALLSAVNLTRQPVELQFSSSQRFDFRLLDCRGREIWRWSDGKAFLEVMGSEKLGPRGLRYPVRFKLVDKEGRPLRPGTYTLEGWITHIPECNLREADETGAVGEPVDELAAAVRFKLIEPPFFDAEE